MSEAIPTNAQDRAITSIDRNVCVRAGAGTGKTFVLVGRYMELLRRTRVPVGQLAALTYTEKAAKEMKDRIRRACLEEERKASDGEDARWWRRQRIDLETAHIGTIHGFCSTILAEHPVEAGVDPYFTLLDEVEQSILLDRAVNEELRRRLDEEDACVLELCREFSPGEVRGMLVEMIAFRDQADDAASRVVVGSNKDILEAVQKLLRSTGVAHVARVLVEISRRGILTRLEDAECTDTTDSFEGLRREVLKIIGELSKAASPERKMELARQLRRAVYTTRGGSKAKWQGDDLAAAKEAFKAIRDLLDEAPGGDVAREASDTDVRSLRLAHELVGLYAAAREAYTREKRKGGNLDFEDLLILARGLLERSDDVRARMQEKVRHLLVDELQDTAVIERDIILAIVRNEETFRKTGDVRIVPGKLFVVGDDKQSIYRFRGAEVTVFSQLAGLIRAQGEVIDLDVNFRTVPAGVAFANDLFGRLLGREEKTIPYENRYFDLTPKRKEDTAFLEVMVPAPLEGDMAADVRGREARMIAGRIAAMVDGREKIVWDADAKAFRPARYGDVAVLFRAMTPAAIYEQAFREAGIPYYIIAGSGFYRAQEILDLLTALKALERPRDRVSLAGALRSPLFGISDETLFFMSQKGSLREGLDAAESVENITDDQRRGLVDARDILQRLSRIKNRVPISRLIEEILRRTGYDALLLAQFMGKQKLANLEKLIDLARSFETKGLFTLDDFLRYIEDFVSVEARESERAAEEETSNVVRMMSVHKAKGLEFPIVFVADLSHQRRGGEGPLLFDRTLGVSLSVEGEDGETPVLHDLIRREGRLRDEAENLRLLYVAVTRARDYLVLSGALRHGKAPAGSWLGLLDASFHFVGENGAIAKELAFGQEGARRAATVRTEVPEIPEDEAQRRHRAGWKVVKRLGRLVERTELAERIGDFAGRRRVEPIALDLSFKRRFVASEFTEYRYCPHRYYLSKILGILPAELKSAGPAGAPGGMVVGTAVHGLLAAWDFKAATLDGTVAAVLAGEGLSGTDAARALAAEVKRIIRSAGSAGLFADMAASKDRRTEYPVAARVGDFVVEGILDSVHACGDGFEIVDYKTDRIEAGGVAELADHYELQMACYALAMAKSGLKVSRISLLFVRAGKRHSWQCDRAQLQAWEGLLSSCVKDIRDGKFDGRRESPCRCLHGWACGREATGAGDLELA